MLKMIKYELIGSWRQFSLGFAIYLLMCVLLPMIPESVIKNVATIGFSTLMMGLMFMLFYMIIAYYQRSMFKKQGYLTLTLPVSEQTLVGAKLMSTLIWYSVGMLVLGIGFFVFVMGVSRGYLSFGELIKLFFEAIKNIDFDIMQILKFLLQFLLQILSMVMSFFFVITLVHTHWIKKHRTAIGIIIYIGSCILLSSLMGLVPGIIDILSNYWVSNFITLLEIIFFYVGTVYLLKHHIELE